MYPSCAISAVLWNPEVLDPFVTVFRMICVVGNILQFRRCAICSEIFRAS